MGEGAEAAVLVGSHARGDAGPESDLDLFVEMESPLSPPRRAVQVDSAFGPRLWPLDVFVYTPQEVSRLKHMNGTLVSIVEREGVVLYERSRV